MQGSGVVSGIGAGGEVRRTAAVQTAGSCGFV